MGVGPSCSPSSLPLAFLPIAPQPSSVALPAAVMREDVPEANLSALGSHVNDEGPSCCLCIEEFQTDDEVRPFGTI